VGVLLGPDVLHLIDPSTLGTGLNALVGFAVAIILFEGGLSLRLSRLRAGGPAIRQLLTVGALVTAVGGALAAKFCLLWPWRTSLLFGTLIIVTGPTVVTPLLRRLKVQQRVSNVLEAEGVLIDAIGAITAVVALDIAISPGGGGLLSGALEIISRLGFGSLLGLAGGALIAWVLRFEKLVPDGLENVLTLSLVIALFQVSNYMMHESGLAAVTVAGVVMGNIDSEGHDDMREFKEQLTMLLIGLLFVLLAADVRVSEVVALGWRGAATVAAVLLIVRPLNVWASTIGSGLTGKERLFMAWMGPRGIVAAAVASLFANELDRYGVEGGSELRALVFLTITASVLVSGLTGGFVARALGLGRTLNEGWIVLGAQDLPHTLAGILKKHGGGAMCIDRNPEHVRLAHLKGVDAVAGNVLEERVLFDARLHSRAGFIGLSPNEELNLKFIERAQELGGEGTFVVSLTDAEESVSAAMVHNDRATVMFGRERDLDAR
jgi:NhaP-type Na+/H+ or K+/H+ antiporter